MFYRINILFIATSFLWLPVNANALINGKPLIATPDVVRILFNNGWMCSGVYIDRWTILTAAHCLQKPSSEKEFHIDKILSENDQPLPVKPTALILHPSFMQQTWHSYDVGIIKTSQNINYQGKYPLHDNSLKRTGRVLLMGAGKYDLKKNLSARQTGENSFFHIGSILFLIGVSTNSVENAGFRTTVAPHDSGGPIVDVETNSIIGVMSTTTVQQSARYGLLALSTCTSIMSKSNLDFLKSHMGPNP